MPLDGVVFECLHCIGIAFAWATYRAWSIKALLGSCVWGLLYRYSAYVLGPILDGLVWDIGGIGVKGLSLSLSLSSRVLYFRGTHGRD